MGACFCAHRSMPASRGTHARELVACLTCSLVIGACRATARRILREGIHDDRHRQGHLGAAPPGGGHARGRYDQGPLPRPVTSARRRHGAGERSERVWFRLRRRRSGHARDPERRLTGEDTVTVTLSAASTAGNRHLRYALRATPQTCPGPKTGPRGDLRDPDTTPSQTGADLANWAVAFDAAIPSRRSRRPPNSSAESRASSAQQTRASYGRTAGVRTGCRQHRVDALRRHARRGARGVW